MPETGLSQEFEIVPAVRVSPGEDAFRVGRDVPGSMTQSQVVARFMVPSYSS